MLDEDGPDSFITSVKLSDTNAAMITLCYNLSVYKTISACKCRVVIYILMTLDLILLMQYSYRDAEQNMAILNISLDSRNR